MKLYGYAEGYREEDNPKIHTLGEVTLSASPDELKKIAQFFIHSASQMEKYGTDYEHEHLSGFDDTFSYKSDIIISSL